MRTGQAWLALAAALMVAALAGSVRAEEISRAEFDALKREVEAARLEKAQTKATAPAPSPVEKALDNKYGPGATVTTKAGKLTLSGLVQVWYYGFQTSKHGIFNDQTINKVADANVGVNNSGFRIRRTELKFDFDINEYLKGVVMIDPAREAQSWPALPDNQANSGIFVRGTSPNIANLQGGTGSAPRLLQDAYINYHGFVLAHDFQIGQFKPAWGEEGIRGSSQLDFAERSFVGQLGDARDLGAQIHGTWWTDRFQYWVGVFDNAGNYYGSGGQAQNRADDNNAKDFALRLAVQPIKSKDLGTLEVGGSTQFGRHGNQDVANLARPTSWAQRHDVWTSYMAPGPAQGLWLRGEWAWLNDRNVTGQVIDVAGYNPPPRPAPAAAPTKHTTQENPRPFASQGWYLAVGYKFNDCAFKESMPDWMRGFELAGRYDTFWNVQVADQGDPSFLLGSTNNPTSSKTLPGYLGYLDTQAGTDTFRTVVWTAGINYYLKGHNAKIQANYNWVSNPEVATATMALHRIQNNSFILNFQLAF